MCKLLELPESFAYDEEDEEDEEEVKVEKESATLVENKMEQ